MYKWLLVASLIIGVALICFRFALHVVAPAKIAIAESSGLLAPTQGVNVKSKVTLMAGGKGEKSVVCAQDVPDVVSMDSKSALSLRGVSGMEKLRSAQRQLIDELSQKNSAGVLESLKLAWHNDKSDVATIKRQLTISILGQLLQQEVNEQSLQTYEALRKLLIDPAISDKHKMNLLAVLGKAQTVGAVKILLELCEAPVNDKIKIRAIKEISQIDEIQFEGRFREELAPLLEQAWQGAGKDDAKYEAALALALARVGTQRGVTLLVAEACAGGTSVEDMDDNKTPRSMAASAALRQVRNPGAIPLLQELLKKSNPGSSLEFVSGNTLAGMGKPGATQVLLQWSQTSGDEGEKNASQWFGLVRDPTSLVLVRDAIKDPGRFPFSSDKVRSAVATSIRNVN